MFLSRGSPQHGQHHVDSQGTQSLPEHIWDKQLVSGINPKTLKQNSLCKVLFPDCFVSSSLRTAKMQESKKPGVKVRVDEEMPLPVNSSADTVMHWY